MNLIGLVWEPIRDLIVTKRRRDDQFGDHEDLGCVAEIGRFTPRREIDPSAQPGVVGLPHRQHTRPTIAGTAWRPISIPNGPPQTGRRFPPGSGGATVATNRRCQDGEWFRALFSSLVGAAVIFSSDHCGEKVTLEFLEDGF